MVSGLNEEPRTKNLRYEDYELELRESRVTDANVAANWTDVPTPGYQSRKSMDLKQQATQIIEVPINFMICYSVIAAQIVLFL